MIVCHRKVRITAKQRSEQKESITKAHFLKVRFYSASSCMLSLPQANDKFASLSVDDDVEASPKNLSATTVLGCAITWDYSAIVPRGWRDMESGLALKSPQEAGSSRCPLVPIKILRLVHRLSWRCIPT